MARPFRRVHWVVGRAFLVACPFCPRHPNPDRSFDLRAAAVSPSRTVATHRQTETELRGTVERVRAIRCADTLNGWHACHALDPDMTDGGSIDR